MYASAMRLASEVMEDDHIKIGENGLLYRVVDIHLMDEDEKGFVMLHLCHTGDESQIIVAILCIAPHASLKVYTQ